MSSGIIGKKTLEPLRHELNQVLGRNQPWEEWEIPREAGDPWKREPAALHAKLREAMANDEIGKKSHRTLAKLNILLNRDYTFETLPEKPIDLWTNDAATMLQPQMVGRAHSASA